MEKIVETIGKFNISALLIIGGFEVYYKAQLSICVFIYNVSVSIYLCVTYEGLRRCAAAV